MRIEVVKVTPQMAREWLAVEPERHTRTLKKRNLAKLRAAMQDGDWQLTHQPIALAKNGFVLDGRHRLTVIAEQRKTIRCHVAFDVPDETYKVIDIGATRTPGDSLAVAGYGNTAILAAAARQYIGYDLIVGTPDNLQSATGNVTPTQVVDLIDDSVDGKLLADNLRPGMRVANMIGVVHMRTTVPTLMTLVHQHTDHGPDVQEEFFTRLGDGIQLDAHSPILALRRWLQGGAFAMCPRNAKSTALLTLGITSWNLYAAGKERGGSFTYRPGISVMPEIQ